MENKAGNKKRVFITGIDGYIGWALANYLKEKGFVVFGLDDLSRRKIVCWEMKSNSLIPISSVKKRMKKIPFEIGSTLNFKKLRHFLKEFKPDAIVHLGEQASAPYSMSNQANSYLTQKNNVLGTLNLLWAIKEVCPDVHLIKLGSMTVYGSMTNALERF